MITAVDTDLVVALWDKDPVLSRTAQSALDAALARGALVLSAPVFAELMAAPARTAAFLDSFVRDTGLRVDWNLDETVSRTAGRAFQKYATDRRRQGATGPRRILADFLIGAHASVRNYRLLTLDDRIYRAAFPGLRVAGV